MQKARVLLVDDHALVRAGIASLLKELKGIEVVGQAGSGLEALKILHKQSSDLVLMDIAMPGMNGFETTAQILKLYPNVRVLILSMYIDKNFIQQALRSGASGYVGKGGDQAELETAIRTVLAGGQYVASVESRRERGEEADAINADLRRLSPRQLQVLQLVAHGYTSREIARELNLSVNTIQAHRAQLMRRLNMHDMADLIRLANKAGLLSDGLEDRVELPEEETG